MSFPSAKAKLQKLFDEVDFATLAKAGKQHCVGQLLETCSNGTQFFISLPGLKALRFDGEVQYDYRIDIQKEGVRTALSHANIVVEFYNKVVSGAVPATQLASWLKVFAVGGEFNPVLLKETGRCTPPAEALVNRVAEAHRLQSKYYNRRGSQWSLTLEELFTGLKWIVLQEDFNYPIGRFEGRKMCFARYIEAIHVAAENDSRLEELIARTLSHGRPQRWAGVDYAFLNDVK